MKFRLLNIDFTVSYSLVCLGAICVILNIFLGFLCCVMAVIIHECGHLFAMLICKSPPDKIKISLFEIKITNSSRQLNTTRQNIFIIFFGPLVNFICFILFYLLYLCNSEFLLPIAMANLCTGLFNMLPVMSLDGGQLMYVILCRKFSEKSAERIINITAVIILFPLTVLGFMVLNLAKP